MPDYILQIRINIKANDDPDARFKSKPILDEISKIASIEKYGLREIRQGMETRIVVK